MNGELIHKAMVNRISTLMEQDNLSTELKVELEALADACFAYEDVTFEGVFPVGLETSEYISGG